MVLSTATSESVAKPSRRNDIMSGLNFKHFVLRMRLWMVVMDRLRAAIHKLENTAP